MIQSIKINLNKTTFILNNEAYEKLNAYVMALKNSFKNDSEILFDIEARIAELLTIQLAATNTDVVTANHVAEVIKTVGTIEELTNSKNENKQHFNTPQNADNYTNGKLSTKKLRRNPFNESLSGVCSGLGYYLNIDTSFIRLAFICSLFFFGTGILLYLILWIAVPKAVGLEAEALKNFEINNPNKLFRTKEIKAIGGVCSGIAIHLGIEIWVVRLAFFIGIFVFGISIIGYFLAWLVIPMAYTDFQKTKIITNSQFVVQNDEQLSTIRNIFKFIIAGIAIILLGILLISFFFTAGMFSLFTNSSIYDFSTETFPFDVNLSLLLTGILLVLFSPILFLLVIIAKYAFKANIHIKYAGSGLIFTFFLGIGLLVYSSLTAIPEYFKLLENNSTETAFLPKNDSLKIIINEVETGKYVDFYSKNDFKIQLCDSGMYIPISYQIEKTLEEKSTFEIIKTFKNETNKKDIALNPILINYTISNDSIVFPSHYFLAKRYKFKFQKAKVKFYLKQDCSFYLNKIAQQSLGFLNKHSAPEKFWFNIENLNEFENNYNYNYKEQEQDEESEQIERKLTQLKRKLERKAIEFNRRLQQKILK